MKSIQVHLSLSVIALTILIHQSNHVNSSESRRVLSRKRRHLVFPEGSTLSVALCMTAQTFLQPRELFTEALNWVVSYDLPNNTDEFDYFKRPTAEKERRLRRDVYQKIESVMSSIGFNGKECMYRSLCETAAFFPSFSKTNKESTLIEAILHLIFKFPEENISNNEHKDHNGYVAARAKGLSTKTNMTLSCEQIYSGCKFSLLSLALNYFNGFKTGDTVFEY